MLIKSSSIFLLIAYLSVTLSTPVPSSKRQAIENRVYYDERQEGEWNVRADLKNFVFLIIPSSSLSSSPTPSPTFLDYLSKALPKRNGLKKKHHEKEETVKHAAQETQHFIESKTAPYHVDISTSRSHLAKLHPEPLVVRGEEIVIAKSPTIALLKDEKNGRTSRTLVLTLSGREGRAKKHEKNEKKDKDVKKAHKESHLKLVGDGEEQCGPGLVRDSSGHCTVTFIQN